MGRTTCQAKDAGTPPVEGQVMPKIKPKIYIQSGIENQLCHIVWAVAKETYRSDVPKRSPSDKAETFTFSNLFRTL